MLSYVAVADPEFLFLLASGRRDGNAETLARHAAKSLPSATKQTWLRLLELPLPPFEDRRHTGDGTYPQPSGNERVLFDATLAATDLVFVTPLYWYSLPASAKLYLDWWTAWMRVPGPEFRARMDGKSMWAISNSSDEDRAPAEPLVATLRQSAEYMRMKWRGALIGYGNRPGDVLQDAKTMSEAERFFAGS